MQSFRPFTRTYSLTLAVALLALVSPVQAETIHEAGEPGLEPPRILPDSFTQPPYPEEARADGVQGTVLLRIVVSPAGFVSDVEVFRAPFRGEALAQAALAAARTWRYEPARLGGEAVACRIMAPVAFHAPAAGRTTKDKVKPPKTSRRKKPRPTPALPPEPTQDPQSGVSPAELERAARRAAEQAPEQAPEQTPRPKSPPPPEPEPKRKVAEPKAAPIQETPAKKPAPAPPEPFPSSPEPSQPPPDPQPAPEKTPGVAPAEPSARPEPGPLAPALSLAAAAPDPLPVTSEESEDLLLGQGANQAREVVPGLSPAGGGVLRAPSQGVEVGLEGDRVRSIRYVFEDRDGFSASTYRTPKGLGRGSFCVGIVPAYGRPERRRNSGDMQELVYDDGSERAVFRCRSGRLVELSILSSDAP